MSELLTETEEKIIEVMKERGFEQDLVVGMVLCCEKKNCAKEFFDYLIKNENCDYQEMLNFMIQR